MTWSSALAPVGGMKPVDAAVPRPMDSGPDEGALQTSDRREAGVGRVLAKLESDQAGAPGRMLALQLAGERGPIRSTEATTIWRTSIGHCSWHFTDNRQRGVAGNLAKENKLRFWRILKMHAALILAERGQPGPARLTCPFARRLVILEIEEM